jgi:hypothetical protein
MRQLTDHKVNGLNEAIEITVMDEPGAGGACHEYALALRDPSGTVKISIPIRFQNGPVKEAGFNGWSQEAFLAIVIDRLRSFQAGPFACRDNEHALAHCEVALNWLQKRTRDRMARGVEGTHQK